MQDLASNYFLMLPNEFIGSKLLDKNFTPLFYPVYLMTTYYRSNLTNISWISIPELYDFLDIKPTSRTTGTGLALKDEIIKMNQYGIFATDFDLSKINYKSVVKIRINPTFYDANGFVQIPLNHYNNIVYADYKNKLSLLSTYLIVESYLTYAKNNGIYSFHKKATYVSQQIDMSEQTVRAALMYLSSNHGDQPAIFIKKDGETVPIGGQIIRLPNIYMINDDYSAQNMDKIVKMADQLSIKNANLQE